MHVKPSLALGALALFAAPLCHAGDITGLARACDSCHGVQKWQQDIRFDHDLTDWPLLGMHSIVA